MIWLNKDNSKSLYRLYLGGLIDRSFFEPKIQETKEALFVSITDNRNVSIVSGKIGDKENPCKHMELLGVQVAYLDETTNLFAFIYRKDAKETILYTNDKKLLIDTVRTCMIPLQKKYYDCLSQTSKFSKVVAKRQLNNMYAYFKHVNSILKKM